MLRGQCVGERAGLGMVLGYSTAFTVPRPPILTHTHVQPGLELLRPSRRDLHGTHKHLRREVCTPIVQQRVSSSSTPPSRTSTTTDFSGARSAKSMSIIGTAQRVNGGACEPAEQGRRMVWMVGEHAQCKDDDEGDSHERSTQVEIAARAATVGRCSMATSQTN